MLVKVEQGSVDSGSCMSGWHGLQILARKSGV